MTTQNLKINLKNIDSKRPYGVSGLTISEVKANAIEAARIRVNKLVKRR